MSQLLPQTWVQPCQIQPCTEICSCWGAWVHFRLISIKSVCKHAHLLHLLMCLCQNFHCGKLSAFLSPEGFPG